MESVMKILKALLEEVRAFNLDTDEELDLDALADIDLDALFGDGFGDSEETEYTPLDFGDIGNMSIDDYVDDDGEFGTDSDVDFTGNFQDDTVDEFGFEDDLKIDGDGDEFDIDIDSFDLGGDGEGDEFSLDPESSPEGEDTFDTPQEDINFQGEIRTVRGANLVFKRKSEVGNFEELWIYNVGNDIKRETQIRRAILAGTDIEPGSQESKDSSQRAETSTSGNVQFLHITGLPQ